ncbi:sensor histidine kinase [Streptomyces palmae]|uniref:histidine kinase n=1 Tax=Streptomyces palmae TaxID=1701085 RepID=A0A4Z0H9S7_9ACTN|nr:sensor histidine kinase [Streptomyces palmae]TGB11834.1 sensor histidine kinase [Streptomyces palmae]
MSQGRERRRPAWWHEGGTERRRWTPSGPPPPPRGGEEAEAEPERRWSRLPWRSTLVVLLFTVGGTRVAGQHQPQRADLDALGYTLLVLIPALLVLRQRRPAFTAHAVAAATLLYLGAGYPYGPFLIGAVVAVYAAVVAGQRRAAWSALGLLWAGHLLVVHWLYRWLPPGGDHAAGWSQELAVAAYVAAVLTASELVAARRERWARERAEREAAERRRVDEERLRIARELHDVLAHSISVIHVQAGVGLALLDQRPEQARTALATIKTASKEALGEVRQVLDTLRAPGAAPRSPAPGLDRLPELTEQAASAGLDVRTSTRGTPVALPPGADLAAFRIVQEALTNVVRHSGSRTARVRLHYTCGALELTVDDAGPATGTGETGGGNGLIGMRERAAALGGTVDAGPRPDGGFQVRARLPIGLGDTVGPGAGSVPGRESP